MKNYILIAAVIAAAYFVLKPKANKAKKAKAPYQPKVRYNIFPAQPINEVDKIESGQKGTAKAETSEPGSLETGNKATNNNGRKSQKIHIA